MTEILPYNPIFWLVSPECRARLIQYQYKKYGVIPSIPKPPEVSKASWEITIKESLAEIDKIMRQPASHQEKVE